MPTYSVTDYGATGDGVTDDRAAIQATINAAAATGGIVSFPAGIYSVSIRGPLAGEDAWPRAFTIAPNVTFQGAGSGATIIRLANNQVPYGALLMPATYDGNVSGFSMFDLTLDSNALNNPLYSASDDNQTNFDLKRPRIAVQIMTGSRITIQRCVFTNVIGVWALNFYSYNVSNFLIDNNFFDNIGGGTLNFDSSTINFAGNGGTITNNEFYAANYNSSNVYGLGMRTAIEVHNTDVTVANNQIYGFPVGIIMGGDSPTGHKGLTVKNNSIQSAYNGIQLWPEMGNNGAAVAMNNCTISTNTIVLDVNAWQPLGGVAGAYANGVVIIRNPDDGQIQNLLIQNNNITFTDYAAGTRSIDVDYNSAGILFDRSISGAPGPLNTNVQVIGNTITNALGDGIQFESNQVSLVVSNNVIINPAASPFFADPTFWSGWQSAIFLDGPLAGAQVTSNQYVDNRTPVLTQAGLWWQTHNTGNCVYQNNTANVPLPLGLIYNGGGTGSWSEIQPTPIPIGSIPIDFKIASVPKVKPESVQELLNAIGDSLTAAFEESFNTASIIFGQLNGILPGKNVGPWSNGKAWWFWDSTKGAYVQGLDGVPIGIVMMWGGQSVPVNWLTCDGSEVSRKTYSDLFKVVGETWGPGDSQTTFNLPPGGVAFINAPGFVPDPLVTLAPNAPSGAAAIVSTLTSSPSGVACIGGSQLAPLLTGANLPPMQLLVPFITVQKQQPGIAGLGLPKPYSDTSHQAFNYQVQNNEGAQLSVLAADQSQFPTMPPFATANYIIKYQ